eukprot:1194279-Prorocentrum_minimum.AAC.1
MGEREYAASLPPARSAPPLVSRLTATTCNAGLHSPPLYRPLNSTPACIVLSQLTAAAPAT